MTTYRTGNHNARHVYRGDEEIAVAFTPEDGALIVEALNERERLAELEQVVTERLMPATPADSCTCTVPASKCDGYCSGNWVDPDCSWHGKVRPDPACPVHQGRRARGPNPPPLGPGCNCDGSGRTCPRHGAVI